MNVHRFTAVTAREALALVKEALGPEAMILANKSVGENVEIMACSEDDFAAIISQEPRISMQLNTPPPLNTDPEQLNHVVDEIRAMRDSLESQIAGISWSGAPARPPEQVGTLKELLAMGFSAGLARYLTDNAPSNVSVEERLEWAKGVLAKNLSVLRNEDDLLEQGGVYALIGPTGVGKTTTTAKLAARCVMRHGAGQLALITTDAYRIGAHEQLRIYGKILGVIVHSVKDEVDLRIALEELQNKHTVLIDTVGMSQRDQMVTEQIAMLSGTKVPVKRLLCLNSTSTIETLNEVINAYRGSGLEGCILTKLDEATIANLGMTDVKFPHPLFENDTIHCTTEVLGKRESKSRPDAGIVEFQTDTAGSNALAENSAYLTTPTVAGLLMQRQRFSSTDSPLWVGSVLDGQMAGYRATTTTVVTAGSMTFGDFSQVVIGEWGMLEIALNPYASFTAAITGVRAIQSIDVGIRQAAAFSRATSIT